MDNRITEVHLLSVPFTNDYKHTFYFDSLSAQETKMKTYIEDSCYDFSYQRKDNVIRYPKHFDDIAGCNYVMYKNRTYTDKWYYAFITDIKYVNDGRTDITIETDVMQTYMFDYVMHECFVEREHVIDDTPGANTLPEGLETGEYIVNRSYKFDKLTDAVIIMCATIDLTTITPDATKCKPAWGSLYGNVYSGNMYYVFDASDYGTGEGDEYLPGINAMQYIMDAVASYSQSEAITSLFMCPKSAITYTKHGVAHYASGDLEIPIWLIYPSQAPFNNVWADVKKETVLGGDTKEKGAYVPTNNKLLTYPYCYLRVDNNSGGSAIYHYEYFNMDSDDEQCIFDVNLCVTPGGSVRLIPLYYKNIRYNNGEGITGGKYPICNWTTDLYTNWLTQNAINEKYMFWDHVLAQGSAVGSGAAVLGGPGALAKGIDWTGDAISKVLGQMQQRELHALTPPQLEGNINSGDVTFAQGDLTFTGYQISIKKEYAEIIDGFFNMYGYRVNKIKIPSMNHRESYWFIKTIDANIDHFSDVPISQTDLQKIRSIYDNGITFWRANKVIGTYSYSNKITQ